MRPDFFLAFTLIQFFPAEVGGDDAEEKADEGPAGLFMVEQPDAAKDEVEADYQ